MWIGAAPSWKDRVTSCSFLHTHIFARSRAIGVDACLVHRTYPETRQGLIQALCLHPCWLTVDAKWHWSATLNVGMDMEKPAGRWPPRLLLH